MGIIKRGILGGFSNKVGNIVGSSWKGIAVIKSLPLSVANPRTAAQVMQRSAFTVASKLGSDLLASIIKPLWDRNATGMSGYNAFVQTNIKAVTESGTLDTSKLSIARGRLLPPVIVSYNNIGNDYTITFNNPDNDRFALPSDRIWATIINPSSAKVVYAGITSVIRGTDQVVECVLTFTNIQSLTGVHSLSLGYMREDSTEVSNPAVKPFSF